MRGLHLWGGVGRGKTWLMHFRVEALPEPRKERPHSRRFEQLAFEFWRTASRHQEMQTGAFPGLARRG